jgi:hypothetical protein
MTEYERREDDNRVSTAESTAYAALGKVDGLDRHLATIQSTITADIDALRQEIRALASVQNRPQNVVGWAGALLLVIGMQGASLQFLLGQIDSVRTVVYAEMKEVDGHTKDIMQREIDNAESRGMYAERSRQLETRLERLTSEFQGHLNKLEP